MQLEVENLTELVKRYPELQIVQDITANYGESSEISRLCEMIIKIYQKLDTLLPSVNETSPPKSSLRSK